MGKKVKIVTGDPILSRNFKYQKRMKNRLLEKEKAKEEKAIQDKKRKQMMQIESKVDAKIQQLTKNISGLSKTSKIDKFKSQLLQRNTKKQQSTKPSVKITQLSLSTVAQNKDSYNYHFKMKIEGNEIVQEKKKSKIVQIEEQTRKQISQMFGMTDKEQQKQEQEKFQDKDEIFNLAVDCKKQSQVRIGDHVYHITKNLTKHQQILTKPEVQLSDEPLTHANMFIENYFDNVFIDNTQEQRIQQFRKIVIDHSMKHLSKSLEEQKGRGFTNCKILIITPFVGDARSILDLVQQHLPQFEVNNKEKMEELEDETDFFRIGLKIARKKQQLNYFSSFDHSQIIIASPVGLKSIIGSEGDQKRENSFISSVQILYIDRASVFLMQNWLHLTEILTNMNIMPNYESLKNSIDTIRDSFLQLKGRLFRQSIVFSEFNFPELNALKRNHFHNAQGCATSKIIYPKASINTQYDQQFYKIEVKEPKNDFQMRFQYFKKKFWDDLHNKQSFTKVILFVSSYYEYVKLKNFLQRTNASAQYICEHTAKSKVQSRVAKFNQGHFRMLLMTQRAYYFQICQIKKFHSIYFYSLPKNIFIYEELLSNMIPDENNTNKIVSIYTKFDLLILERIVGSSKAIEMVREYCNNVSFVI